MEIILNDTTGFINMNFVQSLCLLYFPCEKFSEKDYNGKKAVCSLEQKENNLVAEVVLTVNDKSFDYTVKESVNASLTRENSKRVLGYCFVKAAYKAFGFIPPWGLQTGIRPVKALGELFGEITDPDKAEAYMQDKYLTEKKKTNLCTQIIKKQKEALGVTHPLDFSLYISIPFCPSRCTYCSFVSYTTKKLLSLIGEYVQRLCEEIEILSEFTRKRNLRLKTVYFGGGTPTTLSESELEQIILKIKSCFDFSFMTEFTVEAGRPDTVTEQKLSVLKKHGVNRISINTQSADNDVLKTIGRTHTFEEYLNAMEIAKNIGFDTINTDMIAGLPGESLDGFIRGLNKVIDIRPENLTVHAFTVKRSSEFKWQFMKNGEICKDIFDMIDYSQQALLNAGYHPYYMYRQKNTAGNSENVGFSLEGHDGLYNIYIMEEYHSIFAVGAGAVTKLVTPDRKRIERLFSPKYPFEFLDRNMYKGFDVKSADAFYDTYFNEVT